ncbi:LacI family DNA-binding transcriptional regulator [Blautia sp. 1033sp1_1033st1_G9_1033SCRN_220408]|uniref:LacI family DNA-binding transcriptional regulator n=1 Tax=Blautia sp. 1033sp1_1033st1_G9_1033SCRN_220408 TaxID=3144490 RepID=UPI0034A1976E
MAVKLKDIAAKAGVSSTTCSLILNNKPISVSEETKQNVLRIALEMGYMRKQSIHNLGLIVPDLGNLYFTEIIKNVSRRVQEAGYNLVILDSNNSIEQECKNLLQLRNSKVDGIMLSLVPQDESTSQVRPLIREITSHNLPIVLLEDSLSTFGCHSVNTDNYQGGYLATKHLIDLGHTRIGTITGSSDFPNTNANRTTGYMAALTEAGIPIDPELICPGMFTIESGYKYTPYLLEKGVTAIFTHNDMCAFGVYHYLQEHHLRIPDDISLVGFDNLPIISTLGFPLTTVSQPIQQIADRCVDILLQSIQNPSTERTSVTMQPELIIRSSTGPVKK